MINKKAVYIIENLSCANCASKMETKIKAIKGISNVTITFATKQLQFTAKDPDLFIDIITKICNNIEDGIILVKKENSIPKIENKQSLFDKDKLASISIIIGTIAFISLEIYLKINDIEIFSLGITTIFIIIYLILGGKILLKALKNLRKGQIFDENFLMSIATLGALLIQQFPEAIGVILFYRVGEYFEQIAVKRSRKQIMEAVDLRPEVVNRIINKDTTEIVAAKSVQVGDLLLVKPGDRIPVDGEVVTGESNLDTSAITGESIPIKVLIGSKVTSGCVNISGLLTIKVEKRLEDSMVSRILDSVENAVANKPKIDNFITRFSRIYTPVVIMLALFTGFGIPLLTNQAFYPWIYTALTFLVMSCPCALVLSVPLAFFSGIGAGSKKGILFKGGVTLEVLSNIKAVVLDKTGTITKGDFIVQKIISTKDNDLEVLSLIAACEVNSSHPIAISILKEARKQNISINKPTAVEEISGKGIKAIINNQTVLCGNIKLMQDYQVDLKDYKNQEFGTEVLLAVNGNFIGYVVIADSLKEEASETISKLKKLNVEVAMLTGDTKKSALEVASQVGINQVHYKLLPHEKLEKLKEIQNKSGEVMFVGDGINDTPVLAGANVGAAMGQGSDAAIEVADIVFMNSKLNSIYESIIIAKKTTMISKQNVIFAIAIKVLVMLLGITGIYANMWLAVFADTGVAVLCILNSIRIFKA